MSSNSDNARYEAVLVSECSTSFFIIPDSTVLRRDKLPSFYFSGQKHIFFYISTFYFPTPSLDVFFYFDNEVLDENNVLLLTLILLVTCIENPFLRLYGLIIFLLNKRLPLSEGRAFIRTLGKVVPRGTSKPTLLVLSAAFKIH